MEASSISKFYMGGWSDEFCRLADLQLRTKVGHVLPAHSQLLAKESKVVATVLDIGRESRDAPAATPATDTQQQAEQVQPAEHCSHASGEERRVEEAPPPAASPASGEERRAEEALPPAVSPTGGEERRAEEASPPAVSPTGGEERRAEEASPPAVSPTGGEERKAEEAPPPAASPTGGQERRAEEALPPAVSPASSIQAGSTSNSAALTHIFGGYSTPAVQLLLRMVYSPKQLEVGGVAIGVCEEVVRLADQLDAPGILSAFDAALAAWCASRARPVQKQWWELLRLADCQADKLPLTYQSILARVERLVQGKIQPDFQALLEGKEMEGLSGKMLCDLIRKLHK